MTTASSPTASSIQSSPGSPVALPGDVPNLEQLNNAGTARADLVAVLLTGIRAGIVPGFQSSPGTVKADMLRLNVAVPPTPSLNRLGLPGNDADSFPNGRRVVDDIVTIEVRALAGVTYALGDKSFTPDAAATAVTQGVATPTSGSPGTGTSFWSSFPYLGDPYDGFDTPPSETPPATH